ncbi:hypothetical protein O181_048028 [Austropuccinia psidii MF-1]|uniref:Uncharacterized protein n=1 Tax=Austropuccinia psidii MF-1 TaxID=1389203 RepID=A0A9Q3HK34_9BASI|nr:hypothetical protein [Austropuccinia psidii MF-1]
MDTIVDVSELKEIIPILPLTSQFNKNLNPEDWKDTDQVLQLHQLLKDSFQWRIDQKRFNLASNWEVLRAGFQKIYLKEIPFKDLMVITKGWNPNRKLKLLEGKAARIRDNQATIQEIEKKTRQRILLFLSGSQGVKQPNYPVISHHSSTRR